MNSVWLIFTPLNFFLYLCTAALAHLLMSLGQTLFHRHLGHHPRGRIFFKNHVQFHHAHYSGDHIVSARHGTNEGNNTPFFLVPTALAVGLGYFCMSFDLFVVQLVAMSLSFCGHVYIDKQYHLAGAWLGRFLWFRRKQQLHFAHHRNANCNFAVIDYFWDRLLGTYRNPRRQSSSTGQATGPTEAPIIAS